MEKEPKDRCPDCDGNGVIGLVTKGKQTIWADCPRCNGTGIRGNPGCLGLLLVASIVLVIVAAWAWVH